MIIPSIDIQGGRVVQLRQGRDRVWTDSRSPVELARYFARFGPVAVIDLDAALGTGNNSTLVSECCQVAQCRVGGGIRSKEDVLQWIRRGADKVIIGTAASPEFLGQFPREWLIAAIDARNDEVVIEGWRKTTGRCVYDVAKTLAPYCCELLYTCVEREGMLGGAAIETGLQLCESVPVPVTVAGGIRSIDETKQLIAGGCNVQLGRAVYENRIDLADAWVAQIAFGNDGLVPTVVQDGVSGDVRMLAYSNAESLRAALRTGQGWYYSRSRKELWRKGAISGNAQELIAARWDCDRDAVLFRVIQTGPTCHTGKANCFNTSAPDVLNRLASTIADRSRSNDSKSYTRSLLDDPALLNAKLREEIEEVIEADTIDEVAWESADVIYHILVRALAGGVTFDRICAELRSRLLK